VQLTLEKNLGPILWRSFITSLALAIIETLLLIWLLIVIFVLTDMFGSATGIAGNIQASTIIRDCVFVFSMRLVLGFTLLNCLMWIILAGSPIRLPMLGLAIANGASLFVMYCVSNSRYQILEELFTVYEPVNVRSIFNVYRAALLCSLLSPVILRNFGWLPTVLPWVLRSDKEFLSAQ
jgi:hypothetical protein